MEGFFFSKWVTQEKVGEWWQVRPAATARSCLLTPFSGIKIGRDWRKTLSF